MKFLTLRRLAPILVVIFFISRPSQASLNNIVRVDKFKWMHAQTEHFDIYYDKKAEKLLPRMAHYLEGAWQEVGDKYHVHVKERTPFFFFSNHNIFEENNIVPVGEGTGGVTEAFKNRLLIFNDGSEMWLRHVIYHEFTHVVQFNVLYSGFWKSVRLLKSPFYALWSMEGMAEYGAGDIDEVTTNMVIRDAVFTKTLIGLPELQGFNHVKPNQVTLGYKTGEMAIRYLADDYGPEKVGQFLKTMESYFDVSSALEQCLGTDLNRFDLRFQEWLQEKYSDFFEHAKPPTFYGKKLTSSDGIPQFNQTPVVSKDGTKIYYMSDVRGPTSICEYDIRSQKSKILVSMEWSVFENLHQEERGLSLSRDGKWLAFAGEKGQRDFLFLYDLENKKLKRVKILLEQIRNPVFSPVDDTLVCVGMVDGYNDLYIIDKEGHTLERLTNNPQDEKDPVFSPDGKKVLYSGEVMSADGDEPMGRDLYEVSLKDKEPRRLLVLNGEEREPEILPDGSLLFVRDQDDQGNLGYNLYHWDPKSNSVERLTDAVGGAFSPRYVKSTNSLYYVAFYAGEKQIYDFSASTFTARFQNMVSSTQTETSADANEKFRDNNEEAVLNPRQKAVTQAMNTWSEGVVSPLLEGEIQPYQWRSSTDLFIPFFFYSSLDGFVLADIWQASDLLANHQLQEQMQYASGTQYLDLSVVYSYSRFRPTFSLVTRSQQYYLDLEKTERRREINNLALASYPLDRNQSVNIGLGTTNREDIFLDDSQPNDLVHDRYLLLDYMVDTVNGRYLVPTQGQRLSLFYQQGFLQFGGNQEYRSGGLEGSQYFHLARESTIATRMLYGRSVGPEPQVFRMGGADRIRALSGDSEEFKKSNAVLGSVELRYRLAYLSTRTKWLYPDFFFKAAYLTVFDDMGYGWDNQEERNQFKPNRASNSSGVGIFWPTFIIQSFQLNLGVEWAVRTTDGSQVWYITLGPSF